MSEPRYPGEKAGVAYASCTLRRVEPSTDEARAAGTSASNMFELALSSEYEVERSFFGETWREVLDHSAGAIELERLRSGRVPFLVDHDRTGVIGVLSDPSIGDDKVLRVMVRFSKNQRAQEIKRDIEDGIRLNTSIGYAVKNVKMVESSKDKGDLWRVTLWEPLEGSSVAVPADPTVGVGRDASVARRVESTRKESKMPDEKNKDGQDLAEAKVEVGPHIEHAAIVRMCTENGCATMAAEFIEQGLTSGQVAAKVLEFVRTRGVTRGKDPLAAVPKKERQRYSYARAIQIAAGSRDGSAKWDGLEAEIHAELDAKKPPGYQSHGGVFVPLDLRTPEQVWERALDAKTLAKGSETVFEQPGELIELLRNRAAVISLGARVFTGLSGPVGFPKQTSASAIYWVAENPAGDVTDSDAGLGLVSLQPKQLQGSTAYSRQLLNQASIDVELFVRNDLGAQHALAIDRAAIHGLGSAGQPTGIYLAPDVQPQAMGGIPTYALLVGMVGLVADKNATLGTLGWLTTPLMAAKMLSTPEHATATMANWIWQGTLEVNGTGRVAGYRAVASSQVAKTMSGSAETGAAEHGMIFGNWSEMIIGLFANLELVVDPYSKKKRGLIEVTSFQMADLILRHGESFSKSTGATIV